MATNLQDLTISSVTRREMAKAAFYGSNEALADRIKLILGYEMNERWNPANGFSLADAIKTVAAMEAAELHSFIADPVFTIVQDETELLNGDEASMKVVLNNLTGRNLAGEEYENYLNWAKDHLPFPALAPEHLRLGVR